MKWSKYQTPIFDFIKYEKGNLLVNARAGAGKTTVLLEGLKNVSFGKSKIFLAFNKSIVEELKERIPKGTEATTLHSFGLSCLRKRFSNLKIDVKKTMSYLFIQSKKWDECEEMNNKDKFAYLMRIKQIVSLSKLNLAETKEDFLEVIEKHGILNLEKECERAFSTLRALTRHPNIVDFDDMVYLPASRTDIKVPKFDVIFVDECQDLNKAQHKLISKIKKPLTGRQISVGDDFQAIYGFAGADAESFNSLRKIPNTTELPLSITYRCAKNIVKKAQKLVPDLESSPNAPDGIVQNGDFYDIEDGDMVLCRNKKPLIEMCLKLLSESKKAYILGKNDVAVSLINLVKITRGWNIDSIEVGLKRELNKVLDNKMRQLSISAKSASKTMAYDNMLDKIDCVRVIMEQDKVHTDNDVIKKIEHIFDEKNKGVILSTIHKSKGLENERVHILKKELLPSKWAKSKWALEQERNLEYVMITRAKTFLNYIDGGHIEDEKIEE